MKRQFLRFLSAASAAMTMCACTGLYASAEVTDRIMGDLDNDCRVTLYDCVAAAELCSHSLLGLTGDEVTESNYPADIDMDGKITLNDLNAMAGYYAQQLVGLQPLWADFREISYADGTERTADGSPFTLTGMYLEIGCASGKPGEEVTVPVYVAGIDALTGFQYRQSIPTGDTVTEVQLDLAEETDDGKDITSVNKNDNGYTNMIWMNLKVRNIDITDGRVIAYITYKIADDAQSGDTQILTTDTAYNMFGCTTVNGEKHQLECYQYTVVNGVIFVE